jgi:hypothetical protein
VNRRRRHNPDFLSGAFQAARQKIDSVRAQRPDVDGLQPPAQAAVFLHDEDIRGRGDAVEDLRRPQPEPSTADDPELFRMRLPILRRPPNPYGSFFYPASRNLVKPGSIW